ncbi:Hypothetical protein FKW44_021032 [Caligus rogercresseyi]|uniref:Uncharacterized protein n=1 Tax=Caligus rogercresseyi TaxID=217165 RepID=A0A7T8JVU9_CALRO|nr:Hypothetical protein FKW44_021032 [Caligus rogercresseyi]
MFHTDIAWHAKVAVSLPMECGTSWASWGWGRRSHYRVPCTAATVVGVKSFPGLQGHCLGCHLIEMTKI